MKIPSVIFLALLCICTLSACDRRPLRSECIVKIELSSPLKDRVPNDWLKRIFPAARSIHAPLAGISVQGKDVYLQFAKQCPDRKLLAESIVAEANLKLTAPVKLERIEPGPHTSTLSGNAWRD